MPDFEIGFEPKLTFLSDADKQKIYQASLQVIEETGMQVMHEGALTLLKDAGCAISDDRIVKIPAAVVEQARKTVPDNVAIYDREGHHAMDLGGRRAYFGTGSDLMWAVESEGMQRHRTTLRDIQAAARVCDAQIPDMQASYEAGLETFMSVFAGSNLNHDVGYLDFGLTGSLDMIVIVDEMIDQIRRIQKGIPINEESLALDVIPAGVKEGQFLTQAHTVKHLRNVQWQPHLIYRKGYEQWIEEGRTRLLDRARKKLDHLLDRHEPAALVQDKKQAIDAVVERFREKL